MATPSSVAAEPGPRRRQLRIGLVGDAQRFRERKVSPRKPGAGTPEP